MNTLSQQFNDQANWNISMLSLYMLIIIDDIERRKKRRRKRLARLQRSFQETATAHSREQYQRQVQAPHFRYTGPQPQYRVASPGF